MLTLETEMKDPFSAVALQFGVRDGMWLQRRVWKTYTNDELPFSAFSRETPLR